MGTPQVKTTTIEPPERVGYMSVRAAAKHYGVTVKALQRRIDKKQIRCHRFGRRVLLSTEDVEETLRPQDALPAGAATSPLRHVTYFVILDRHFTIRQVSDMARGQLPAGQFITAMFPSILNGLRPAAVAAREGPQDFEFLHKNHCLLGRVMRQSTDEFTS
jgi:excisionase family DNA binding protein